MLRGGLVIPKDFLAYQQGIFNYAKHILMSDLVMTPQDNGKCLVASIVLALLHLCDLRHEEKNNRHKNIPDRVRSKFQFNTRMQNRNQARTNPINYTRRSQYTIFKEFVHDMMTLLIQASEINSNKQIYFESNSVMLGTEEILKIQKVLQNFNFSFFDSLLETHTTLNLTCFEREKYFNFTIKIYSPNGDLLFQGANPDNNHENFNIDILYTSQHFHCITSKTAAFGASYYCDFCNRCFSRRDAHRCPYRCSHCFSNQKCNFIEDIFCTDCNRKFVSQNCFNSHKNTKICKSVRFCNNCSRLKHKNHDCEKFYCVTCKEQKELEHNCLIRKFIPKQDVSNVILAFYDFECLIEVNETCNSLKVNLAVLQTVCMNCINNNESDFHCSVHGRREYIFKGKDSAHLLLTQLFQLRLTHENRGARKSRRKPQIICIAHNGGKFDLSYIAQCIYAREYCKSEPELVLDGNKFYSINLGNLKFIDSLNFLPVPLSSLPAMMGLKNTAKGYFPHLFNKVENQNYVGKIPDREFYDTSSMMSKDLINFETWYSKNLNLEFNFQLELLKYCRLDVDILRISCTTFFLQMKTLTDIYPFIDSITIASYVMKVQRSRFYLVNENDVPLEVTPSYGYRLKDKQSIKAIQFLQYVEHKIAKRRIQTSYNGREKRIQIGGTVYKVDGYFIDQNGIENVVEYHGCHWHNHGCLKHTFRGVVEEFKEKEIHKMKCLRMERTLKKMQAFKDAKLENGEDRFIMHVVWECEFDKMLKENPNLLDNIPKTYFDCLKPRDSFYGGSTDCISVYRKAEEGEGMFYYDFTSLYPSILATGPIPVGPPIKIYVGDEECRGVDFQKFQGLIKCKILPAKQIFHPVLPVKISNKLMFPLCHECAINENQENCDHSQEQRSIVGTWVVDEVKAAIKQGYEILEFFEMVEYQIKFGYFKKFVDFFYKIKIESSGIPHGYSEDTLDQYIEEVREREGIILERDKFIKNPALRSLCKLSLNASYGKYGQSHKTKTRIIRHARELIEILAEPREKIHSLYILNSETIIVSFEKDETLPVPNTNVALAAYVTCTARLRLHQVLQTLGTKVCYFDTDSVIYLEKLGHNPRDLGLPVGPFLGELTNELLEYGEGSYIDVFSSGGPKSYSFRVVDSNKRILKTVTKCKGITLNSRNEEILNFNTMSDIACENRDQTLNLVTRKFKQKKRGGVVIYDETKKWRFNVRKRKVVNFTTFPYGYNI